MVRGVRTHAATRDLVVGLFAPEGWMPAMLRYGAPSSGTTCWPPAWLACCRGAIRDGFPPLGDEEGARALYVRAWCPGACSRGTTQEVGQHLCPGLAAVGGEHANVV